jgi:hypothetical protein
MLCRSMDEILAAAAQESLDEPVRSQEWANRVALILASSPRLAERQLVQSGT